MAAGGLTHTPGGKPSHHRGVKINCTYKYVILLSFHSCFHGSFRQLLLMGRGENAMQGGEEIPAGHEMEDEAALPWEFSLFLCEETDPFYQMVSR